MRYFILLIALIFSTILFSQTNTNEIVTSGMTNFNQLVWADEFNIDGSIDSNKWFHQTKIPAGGSWYNGEIQHYTNRDDNAIVENGFLKIIAKKETFSDQGFTKDYTSARLNSKYAFKYGKVVIRAKLPSGVGTWPAIWTLGKNINEDGAWFFNQGYGTSNWPACGEIDIMEHWGTNQNYVQSATHTASSSGATINLGGQTIPTASTAFHIYTLEWTADKLVFSVDNVIHYTYNPNVYNGNTWPFDLEQYLLLNVAILPSITSSFTSSAMEIDYIRVYQESGLSLNKSIKELAIKVFPNPFNSHMNIYLENASQKNIEVNLFSIEGKILRNYILSAGHNKVSNLENLPKGIYLLQFNNNGKIISRKVFKN